MQTETINYRSKDSNFEIDDSNFESAPHNNPRKMTRLANYSYIYIHIVIAVQSRVRCSYDAYLHTYTRARCESRGAFCRTASRKRM